MGIENAITLIVATAILGLSPGPAVFATVARSISLPFKKTAFFIAGIVLGDFVFAILAMGGLAMLVSQQQILFHILKLVGALYLLYLGMMALISNSTLKNVQAVTTERRMKLFVSGLLLTAGNPKDLLFFVSFLPAFIDLTTAGIVQMLIAAVLIALTFTVTLSFYAVLVSITREWLSNKRIFIWFDKIAGVILIVVGLTIILVD